MTDPMKDRLDRLQRFSESAKRRAGMYSDIAGMDDGRTASSLGALQKAPAPGKKLQKIGFLMLWVPEPTGVTIAVGAPMIAAGRFLEKKYNSATIRDVGHQTKSNLDALSDFKSRVM